MFLATFKALIDAYDKETQALRDEATALHIELLALKADIKEAAITLWNRCMSRGNRRKALKPASDALDEMVRRLRDGYQRLRKMEVEQGASVCIDGRVCEVPTWSFYKADSLGNSYENDGNCSDCSLE